MLLAQVQERVVDLRGRSAQVHRGKNTTVPVIISSAESAQVHRGKDTTVLAAKLECPTSSPRLLVFARGEPGNPSMGPFDCRPLRHARLNLGKATKVSADPPAPHSTLLAAMTGRSLEMSQNGSSYKA